MYRFGWLLTAAVAALVVLGCGDDPRSSAQPGWPPLLPAPELSAEDAGPVADAAPVLEALAGPEAAALERAGAVAAWTAVVERSRLLHRRDQRGAVYGRLTGAVDGQRWLVDETEGQGALAIRVALPAGLEVPAETRVLLVGAWKVDEERRWQWAAQRVVALPAAASAPAAFEPAAREPQPAVAPEAAVPVSRATGTGEPVLFQVREGPRSFAAGWKVGDPGGKDVHALLFLPGEREPYGAQELLGEDEHWRLERGVTYAVPIETFRRPRRHNDLLVLRATAAPVRVVEAPPAE